jgi:hypothetical protein
MKKLIVVLVSLFVISTTISAQNTNEIKYYRTGKWNYVTETWDYSNLVPGNGLLLTVNSATISLDDNRGSIYTTYQTIETDKKGIANTGSHYTSSSFRALDKDGVRCMVILVSYKEDHELKVSIMYDSDIINYFVKTK